MRFRRHAQRRDHRKVYLLVETGPGREKFIYDYELDPSSVAEVALDPSHDARDIYAAVDEQGARPVIKPRKGAREGEINARGRSLRWRRSRPTAWQRSYGRRVIVESVNSSIKRRFGDRLRSRGVWNQRREFGLRMLVYDLCMLNRWRVRVAIKRGEM